MCCVESFDGALMITPCVPAPDADTSSRPVLAAHGCSTNEPDRDHDGVPDKDDAYPDDPTRWKAEGPCGEGQIPSMKIYFIPFKTETLEPVKMGKTIELESTTALWVYDNDKVAGDIKSILQRAKEPLEENKVEIRKNQIRLKVVFPKESLIYYVDKDGTVLKNKSLTRMTDEQMEELELKIKNIGGILDLNVKPDWKDHLR